jgi:hypothetical protein
LFDLLSLIALPEPNSAPSIELSAPVTEDFSAVLTELVGTGEETPAPVADALTATPPVQPMPLPSIVGGHRPPLQQISESDESCGADPKSEIANRTCTIQTGSSNLQFRISDLQSRMRPISNSFPSDVLLTASPLLLRPLAESEVVQHQEPLPVAQQLEDDPAPILRDIQKIEVSVHHEPVKPFDIPLVPIRNEPVVTTDLIRNIEQSQLPPRITPIQKIEVEAKDRTKPTAAADATHPDSPTSVVANVTHLPQTMEAAEQTHVPHQVEIPEVPKFQVVRTVSMEVGDPGSQVTIRIEDRPGGMSLHLGTTTETLHRTLEASVVSLVHALKREQIPVATVQVSTKSSIQKVRRMKEAH